MEYLKVEKLLSNLRSWKYKLEDVIESSEDLRWEATIELNPIFKDVNNDYLDILLKIAKLLLNHVKDLLKFVDGNSYLLRKESRKFLDFYSNAHNQYKIKEREIYDYMNNVYTLEVRDKLRKIDGPTK